MTATPAIDSAVTAKVFFIDVLLHSKPKIILGVFSVTKPNTAWAGENPMGSRGTVPWETTVG